MFGGKKLRDLTEEDIRKYAASLAEKNRESYGTSQPASEEVPAPAKSESSGPSKLIEEVTYAPPPEVTYTPPPVRPKEGGAPSWEVPRVNEANDPPEVESKKLAQMIAERGVKLDAIDEIAAAKNMALEKAKAVDQQQQKPPAAQDQELLVRLSEEEQLRLEVLSELERSQMPAVHKDDGILLKTIEHYTFADSAEVATIYIELDKDLFEGAAASVSEANVEVTTRETDVTIVLHGVPASKTVAALADWRLHLSPLFHSVEPSETKWKLRKGKVSVRLKKRKMQDWRKLLKF